MAKTKSENKQEKACSYLLEPGHIYFTKNPEVIHTVLGSAVSVCLWDRRLNQGGVNHFRWPSPKEKGIITEKAMSSADFGDGAIMGLLRLMKEEGSKNQDIVAQIFGGGSCENRPSSIGNANIKAAKRILSKLKIKIISEDIGGFMGRKLAFDTSCGQAAILKVFNLRETDWFD